MKISERYALEIGQIESDIETLKNRQIREIQGAGPYSSVASPPALSIISPTVVPIGTFLNVFMFSPFIKPATVISLSIRGFLNSIAS